MQRHDGQEPCDDILEQFLHGSCTRFGGSPAIAKTRRQRAQVGCGDGLAQETRRALPYPRSLRMKPRRTWGVAVAALTLAVLAIVVVAAFVYGLSGLV